MLLDSQKKLTGKEEIFLREKSTLSVDVGNTRVDVLECCKCCTSGKLFGTFEEVDEEDVCRIDELVVNVIQLMIIRTKSNPVTCMKYFIMDGFNRLVMMVGNETDCCYTLHLNCIKETAYMISKRRKEMRERSEKCVTTCKRVVFVGLYLGLL